MGIDQAVDIAETERSTVLALLQRHLPGTKVWVYGSRAKWTSTPQSDLNLVVFSTPQQRHQVGDLQEAFDESSLPFRVVVSVWDEVADFHHRINTEHVVLCTPKQDGPEPGWHRYEVSSLIDRGALIVGDVYRARNSELAASGPPFARARNIASGFWFADADHFSEDRLLAVGNKVSRPGDVVFTSKGSVGRFALVRADTERFVYSPQLCFWRSLDHSVLDPRFLYYWMQGREFYNQFKSVSGQTDMAEYVSLTDQRRMFMTAPPVREQRAIARILGTLDDKVELNRRMSDTLEAMAQALYKSWFVDFEPVRAKMEGRERNWAHCLWSLFPDRIGENGLPYGWKVSTVGDHVTNFDAKRVPVSGTERARRKGKFPYYGAAGVMDHVDDYLFDGVYLLLGEDGSVMRKNGLAVTQYVWGKFWVNNHAHVLQGKGPVSTEQVYLHFAFESVAPYVTGAVQPKLSQGRMKRMPFVFSCAEVCQAFAECTKHWFARIRACREEMNTLMTLRDTLLPKLISGELRVKDATTVFDAVL